MATRKEIIDAARSYVGVKWRHLGRTRAGLDCIGLLVTVAIDCRISVVDSTDYGRIPDEGRFLNLLRDQSDLGSKMRIRTGSILLLTQAGRACHCGIVSMEPPVATIIHAGLLHRQVVEEPFQPWFRDIFEVREFKGVTD